MYLLNTLNMLQKLVWFEAMLMIKFGQLPAFPTLSPSEFLALLFIVQGSYCFSHPPLLQFETHAGKEGKGSVWEERWKNHTHFKATTPSCLHMVKRPEREFAGTHLCVYPCSLFQVHFSFILSDSFDFGISQFHFHDGGKTNKGKCL